jgi:glycosyltransferase involved in cell wall biosynthesis
VRVGLDATPLLGRRTGIGLYTERLLGELAGDADQVVATAFTLRGARGLAAAVPDGVTARSRPVPARLLRALWARTSLPPVGWLCGRVDVFHATNFVLPPTGRAAGVLTIHDLSFLRFPETVTADSLRYRELVPRSIRRAAVVCALSKAMAAEIADEYGLDADAIVVTAPGVDTSWFTASPPDKELRTKLGLPERYLLAVGTLEPRKNLPRLVAAYRQLRAADPDVPALVLAGPPGWGPALDLESLPRGAAITTGYLDTGTLQRVMAGASCLAFPSRYEGFGIPPVEAFACGVPVVASDLRVTREVLGGLATLVPADDVDALADALLRELSAADGPDAAPLREKRRAHAATWTWRRCAGAARTAYRHALERAGQRR